MSLSVNSSSDLPLAPITLVFADGERAEIDEKIIQRCKPDFYEKPQQQIQIVEEGGKVERILSLPHCPFSYWQSYYLPKLSGSIHFPAKRLPSQERDRLDEIMTNTDLSQIKEALFIKIPKNGTTSMKEIIRPFPCITYYGRDRSSFINRKRALEAKKELPEVFENSLTIAIVRNPYARAVSAWKYANLFFPEKLSFLEYLTRIQSGSLNHLKAENQAFPQYGHLTDHDGNVIVDLILRLENISEDFEGMKDRLNLPDELSYPKLNVTQSNPYQLQYSKETFDLVSEIYCEDLEMLGYATTWDVFRTSASSTFKNLSADPSS